MLLNVRKVVATVRARPSAALPAMDGVRVVHGCELLEEGSFDGAFQGVQVVFHAASPFPESLQQASQKQQVVSACIEGTLNVSGGSESMAA